MTAVIQRINSASVIADGKPAGSSGDGLLVLLGVLSGDSEELCDRMAAKIAKMRIFEDDGGKMNLSVKDIGGSVLLVSNFTLCGGCRHGNRPEFTSAERPERAELLYKHFFDRLTAEGIHTETGVFGADMQISASLNGPVTIILDSNRDLSQK